MRSPVMIIAAKGETAPNQCGSEQPQTMPGYLIGEAEGAEKKHLQMLSDTLPPAAVVKTTA